MRVVHYIPDFGLGGVQKAGCVVAAAMAQSGHSAWVVAPQGGPRFNAAPPSRLTHRVFAGSSPLVIADEILQLDPEVIHIHGPAYREAAINHLYDRSSDDFRSGRRMIVSTPVFGRPPLDRSLLDRTRTCCVGLYTFYRLCRWLGLSAAQAIARGIGYVPLTPYEPPAAEVSATDAAPTVALRRQELGIQGGAFVVGRIGRNDAGKWHPDTERLVNALLERYPTLTWLSVGYPEERGLSRLGRTWPGRFRSLPETADYNLLTRVLSSMDVQIFASSNGECFASSISEAAGLGVPTIALATPLKDNGQAEQIIEGATGILVASTNEAVEAVGQLVENTSALARLKQSAQRYARDRWHVDRVARDLVSLYEHWFRYPAGMATDTAKTPKYVQTMLDESAPFFEQYASRMAAIMGRGILRRAKWRLMLAAVESWPVFRVGRYLKRIWSPAPTE